MLLRFLLAPKIQVPQFRVTTGRHLLAESFSGLGIELGVASGYFSETILRNIEVSRLYSVDRWSDHHDNSEYILCASRLSRFGCRSVMMRMDFSDAIIHFPDNFFDFIYIDAYAHEGQQGGKLLDDWWPKLKVGGIFSGHDYDEKWPLTVKAVDRFSRDVGRPIEVCPGVKTQNREDSYASWIIRK